MNAASDLAKEQQVTSTSFHARRRWSLTALLAACAALTLLLAAAPAKAAFGLAELDTLTHEPATGSDPITAPPGKFISQAGAHGDATVKLHFNTKTGKFGYEIPDGAVRDVVVDLPPGFIGDPTAVPQCSASEFFNFAAGACPPSSQVGIAKTKIPGAEAETPPFFQPSGVYNLTPSQGEVAAFGFYVILIPVKISVRLDPSDGYHVQTVVSNISQASTVFATELTMWGVPADPVHDFQRYRGFTPGYPSHIPPKPFLSLPPACLGALPTKAAVRAWGAAEDDWQRYEDHTDNPETGLATGSTGCNKVPFGADFEFTPESTRASAPSEYVARLRADYDNRPQGIANATIKDVSVTLPEGVRISPSSSDGLGACSAEQLGLGTNRPVSCPPASKIGDVRIKTPLLDEEVTGEVYLREPTADRLFGLAIVARANGVLIKLPGEVDPDPVTGQITTNFRSNPQMPFELMTMRLKGGARSPLVNPATCGVKTTTARITSWAGHTATSKSSYVIDRAADGGPCKPQGFDPTLDARLGSSKAGSPTAFSLTVARPSGDQELSTLSTTLPEGLLAKLAGVPVCDAAAADAGTCATGSQVGRLAVAAGEGSNPLWVPQPGRPEPTVSLAGPYGTAPYSLSIVVPAQAGPFDLGRVVVRVPLEVDRATTQVTARVAETRVYDRFGRLSQRLLGTMPTVLEGVVLSQRELRVIVDRPGFMRAPTSCAPKQVSALVGSSGGQVRELGDQIQATGCGALAFGPRLSMSLSGQMKRSGNPALRAVMTQPAGGANIDQVQVILPKTAFIDNAHINNPCTRAQYAAEACPAKSVLGTVEARTPLLDEPLRGKVYFRANGGERELPDIVAALRGQIAVDLVGYIDSVQNKKQGTSRVRTTFAMVPDAPVARFEMNLKGGKVGLIENSANLCKVKANKATVLMDGQNGRVHDTAPLLGTSCGKKKAAKRR